MAGIASEVENLGSRGPQAVLSPNCKSVGMKTSIPGKNTDDLRWGWGPYLLSRAA